MKHERRTHDGESGVVARRPAEVSAPARARPLAPTPADRVLALQRAVGNRATTQVLQRAPSFWGRISKALTGSYLADVGAEEVWVADESEEKQAAQIVADIQADYGIEVSSIKSVKAIKSRHSDASADVLKKAVTRPWLFKELKAIKRALKHYAPVLGGQRKFSSRDKAPQEVVSVGKAEVAILGSGAATAPKPTVMGEYFREDDLRNFAMYKHGETATPDFPGDIDKQMEATAVHEIAHGIFRYAIPDFIAASDGYWLDETTKSGKAGVEAPPTSYGQTNAREDMCETVMLYFVDAKRLEKGNGAAAGAAGNPCPKRYALIDKLVTEWTSRVGDFPDTAPTGDTAMA